MKKQEKWSGDIYRVAINEKVHKELFDELNSLAPSARSKRLQLLASVGLVMLKSGVSSNNEASSTSPSSHAKYERFIDEDILGETFGEDGELPVDDEDARMVKSKLLGSLG